MTPARRTILTHALAVAIGVLLGSCVPRGSDVSLSGFGLEFEIATPIAAKLEGLTPEEREAVLRRGLIGVNCPTVVGEERDDKEERTQEPHGADGTEDGTSN